MAVSLIGGENRMTRVKTTNLSQVTDKLYHIILYQVEYCEELHMYDTRFKSEANLLRSLKKNYTELFFFLTSCFGLMTDSAVVDSALVDAALRKSGLISN